MKENMASFGQKQTILSRLQFSRYQENRCIRKVGEIKNIVFAKRNKIEVVRMITQIFNFTFFLNIDVF